MGEGVKLHPLKPHTKLRGNGLAAAGEENIAFPVCSLSCEVLRSHMKLSRYFCFTEEPVTPSKRFPEAETSSGIRERGMLVPCYPGLQAAEPRGKSCSPLRTLKAPFVKQRLRIWGLCTRGLLDQRQPTRYLTWGALGYREQLGKCFGRMAVDIALWGGSFGEDLKMAPEPRMPSKLRVQVSSLCLGQSDVLWGSWGPARLCAFYRRQLVQDPRKKAPLSLFRLRTGPHSYLIVVAGEADAIQNNGTSAEDTAVTDSKHTADPKNNWQGAHPADPGSRPHLIRLFSRDAPGREDNTFKDRPSESDELQTIQEDPAAASEGLDVMASQKRPSQRSKYLSTASTMDHARHGFLPRHRDTGILDSIGRFFSGDRGAPKRGSGKVSSEA